MDAKLIRYLESLSLFQGTPHDALDKIAHQIDTHSLQKGDVLIHKGAPSDSLFIIRTGWVKVVAEETQGEEVVLNQCGPGEVMGEMSLTDKQPRSNTVVALSPTRVLEIKYDVILDVLNEHPILAFSLMRDMADRIRFSNAYINESIQWCQYIATGNYEFVQNQVQQSQATIIDATKSHEARASAFLSAFFKMVEGVKKREENLKQQVQMLTIQIDEAKRKQAVSDVTENDFFKSLKSTARKLRQERQTKIKDQPQENED